MLEPTITINKSTVETVIDSLGFEIENEKIINPETGEQVVDIRGKKVTIENFGGIQKIDSERSVFVADNFCSIADAVELRHEKNFKIKPEETYKI